MALLGIASLRHSQVGVVCLQLFWAGITLVALSSGVSEVTLPPWRLSASAPALWNILWNLGGESHTSEPLLGAALAALQATKEHGNPAQWGKPEVWGNTGTRDSPSLILLQPQALAPWAYDRRSNPRGSLKCLWGHSSIVLGNIFWLLFRQLTNLPIVLINSTWLPLKCLMYQSLGHTLVLFQTGFLIFSNTDRLIFFTIVKFCFLFINNCSFKSFHSSCILL